MKNKVKEILAAASASLLLFTSCSAGEAVLTYKDSVITENEFTYYLATYKSRYLNAYSDFEDKASFYTSTLGDTDVTAEEFLFDSILHNVKMSLVCDVLAEENGLTVSKSTEQIIDDYIDDFITEYSGGSKTQFNQALSLYGINADMLRDIYLRDELGSALFDYLYGSKGTIGVSDADRTAYLNDNYVRVRHIYVNNKYVYSVDEDGVIRTNTDGTYKTEALSGTLLEEQNAKIAAIDEALANGENFDTVYTTYSEDTLYENGYYLSRSMDFVDNVVVSAFDLEIGNYVKVESDVGTHYIMRLEMDESPWSDKKNADFFPDYDTTVATELFTAYVESYVDDVEVNEELLENYSVEASPTNSRF